MLYIDFETRSYCDLTASGSWRYAQDPTTEILCMAYAFSDTEPKIVIGSELPDIVALHIDMGGIVEAHNAMFERALWESICVKKYGWPEIKPEQWRCSAALCARWGVPRDLKTAPGALGLDQSKDAEGRAIMLQLCKPRKTKDGLAYVEDANKFERLYEYCLQDVQTEKAISKCFQQDFAFEQQVWALDQRINYRGVPIDRTAVENALELLALYTDELDKEARKITGGLAISQRDKILAWASDKGVSLPSLTKEAVADCLTWVQDKEVKRILEIRAQYKTSTAKYERLQSSMSEGDRIRDAFVYYGALTGRWSGRLAQFQNLPKGSVGAKDIDAVVDSVVKKDVDAINAHKTPPMEQLSSCLRGMVAAGPKTSLYVADFAAIEARAIAWLANCDLALNQFKKGEDLYVTMAAKIYKINAGEVTKDQRQLGKAAVLGAGYGMGHKTFYKTCASWGMQVSEQLAKSAITTYRSVYCEIRDLWRYTELAATNAIRYGLPVNAGLVTWFTHNGNLHCKLPSGRSLTYRNAKLRAVETLWGGEGYEITYMGSKEKGAKWVPISTYGGKLVENITQAIARDLLAESMLRLEAAGYDIVMHIHDEVVCEVPDNANKSLGEYELIMSQIPAWAEGMPISVEGWVGKRFKK